MRKILFLFLALVLHPPVCPAQTADKAIGTGTPADKTTQSQNQTRQQTRKGAVLTFRMGRQTVLIPSPDGFDEASTQVESVQKFFEATEAPTLDLLAVHLPFDIIESLKGGERFNLSVYTKVSVMRRLREIDFSVSEFARGVSALQANPTKVFDFSTPEMRALMRKNSKNLTELFERETKMDLSQPVNLGELEKTANSYGAVLLLKVKFEIDGKQEEHLVVGGASMVRIKQRIVYIYTYRRFNSNEDIELLKTFTKQWLAQIVKANQS